MNHLIIFMHPIDKSFNGAILNTYINELEQNEHNVEVRKLYEQNFNPILTQQEYEDFFKGIYREDIEEEHQFILWSDIITFIYPLWWSGFPAIGKGYIDRVFSFGFAYRLNGEEPIPLLKNKKAVTICTMGTPDPVAKKTGIVKSMNHSMDESIFDFCGIEVIDHLYFGNVILATDEERRSMLSKVTRLAKKSR